MRVRACGDDEAGGRLPRGDEVGGEEEVEEDALSDPHGGPEDLAGLLELEPRQQVHALVLGLLLQTERRRRTHTHTTDG